MGQFEKEADIVDQRFKVLLVHFEASVCIPIPIVLCPKKNDSFCVGHLPSITHVRGVSGVAACRRQKPQSLDVVVHHSCH